MLFVTSLYFSTRLTSTHRLSSSNISSYYISLNFSMSYRFTLYHIALCCIMLRRTHLNFSSFISLLFLFYFSFLHQVLDVKDFGAVVKIARAQEVARCVALQPSECAAMKLKELINIAVEAARDVCHPCR